MLRGSEEDIEELHIKAGIPSKYVLMVEQVVSAQWIEQWFYTCQGWERWLACCIYISLYGPLYYLPWKKEREFPLDTLSRYFDMNFIISIFLNVTIFCTGMIGFNFQCRIDKILIAYYDST